VLEDPDSPNELTFDASLSRADQMLVRLFAEHRGMKIRMRRVGTSRAKILTICKAGAGTQETRRHGKRGQQHTELTPRVEGRQAQPLPSAEKQHPWWDCMELSDYIGGEDDKYLLSLRALTEEARGAKLYLPGDKPSSPQSVAGEQRLRRGRRGCRDSRGTAASAATGAEATALAARSAGPLDENNRGHQLLMKLGWAPGNGLGADGGGSLEPVAARLVVQASRKGLGAMISMGGAASGDAPSFLPASPEHLVVTSAFEAAIPDERRGLVGRCLGSGGVDLGGSGARHVADPSEIRAGECQSQLQLVQPSLVTVTATVMGPPPPPPPPPASTYHLQPLCQTHPHAVTEVERGFIQFVTAAARATTYVAS